MKLEHMTISTSEKLGLISNIATMLAAGIPIIETIDSLLPDAKGNTKKLLETMRADLMQGQHINQTFAKFPKIFDNITVNILKASEEAGTLDIALNDLRDGIKKDQEFTDKIKSAMIYPVFIMFVFVAVLLMILIVVVPKISTVFSRLTVKLPLPTKILITMSDTLLKHTLVVLTITAVIGTGIFFFIKYQKRLIMDFLFRLPLVSKLAQEIDLTRFSRGLYLLMNAGLPITIALELTQAVVLKKEVKQAIVKATAEVNGGKKLSDGFKQGRGVFPPIMMRIIEAGEKSGSLDKSMKDVSDYLDYQVSDTLKLLTALLEPAMLVMVGIMVGGMMLAVIAPIYGLIGQVGTR